MITAKGCVKNYHWGKTGEDNYIARFQAVAPKSPSPPLSPIRSFSNGQNNNANNNNNNNNSGKPLAELWFGSHPSGPAKLVVGNHSIRLDEFLAKEPEMVGAIDCYFKYNKQLPFLFKILSVGQPLSLQAHPDKQLAQILHKTDPKNYPDANHKPELAVALTDFYVLCDFRPYKEILDFMDLLEPLKQVVGKQNYENFRKLVINARQQMINSTNTSTKTNSIAAGLGECFKTLMTTSGESIAREARNLIQILTNHSSASVSAELLQLIVELNQLYPGDPGIFAPLFLNYIKLDPGQAVYLSANKLHAYLKGECIECMACSDNVVRAGLTSKFRDVQTLIQMLDYEAVRSYKDLILEPKPKSQSNTSTTAATLLYAPTDEFKVERIVINPKANSTQKEHILPAVSSGSFLIVLNGKATTKDFFDMKTVHKLGFGSAGFVPPKISLKLTDINGTLVMYRAYC